MRLVGKNGTYTAVNGQIRAVYASYFTVIHHLGNPSFLAINVMAECYQITCVHFVESIDSENIIFVIE
jgi:hypothetical protein